MGLIFWQKKAIAVKSIMFGLTVSLSACSSGGGDGEGDKTAAPIGDLRGTWSVSEVVNATDCGEGIYNDYYNLEVISQNGSSITVSNSIDQFTGTLSGNSLTWSGSYPEDGGTTSSNVGLTVAPSCNSLSGSARWSWSNGVDSCSGTSQVSATRVNAVGCGIAQQPTSCPSDVSKAYVANNQSASVSVINLSTNTVCDTIAVGSGPTMWQNDLNNNRIYVVNTGSDTVTVVNTANDEVVTTLNTGDAPKAVSIDYTRKLIYVVNQGSESVSVFQTQNFNTYTQHPNSPVALPAGSAPHKIRANSTTGKVYVLAITNDIFELDGTNLAAGVTATIDSTPTDDNGAPTLRRIGVDETNNIVYVTRTHSDATADRLVVIDAGNNNSVTNVPVVEGADRFAFDEAKNVYVSASFGSNSSTVTHYNASVPSTDTFTTGIHPDGIAVTKDGTTLYVSNRGSSNTGNTVSIIATANNTKTDITVGVRPTNLVLSESLNRVLVSNRGSDNNGNTVSIINTETNTEIAKVTVGTRPSSIKILEK